MSVAAEPFNKCEQKLGLNVGRGLIAALGFGIVGFIVPVLLIWLFVTVRWIIEGSNDWERPGNIAAFYRELIGVALGVMAVLSAAGWATFAPRNRIPFVLTVGVIFVASIVGWIALGSMNLTPERPRKSERNPTIYPSEFFVLVTPPIIAGLLISAFPYTPQSSSAAKRRQE